MPEGNSIGIVRKVNNFTIEFGKAYRKQDLDENMNLTRHAWAEWHRRGLKKLNTNTKEAWYKGSELLAIWET